MFEKLFGTMENGIADFLSELSVGASQKAAAAKETADVMKTEKGRIADVAAAYDASGQKALERLQTIEAKGEDARRMAESNNIIDRITLIGEQMFDPRNYTADGRSRQVSEMSQNLAMEGQIHNITAQASEARIAEAQAKEVAATAGIDAKMNIMKVQVDGLALANQGIAQAETLRQQTLATQDLSTLQKSLMGPMDPKANGKIVIQGMQYTPAEIMERTKALDTRAKLALLPPQATNPEYATQLRAYHDLQLANYSLPELMDLKSKGYIMPDGTQVDPGVWDAQYSRQNQLQQDALQLQMNQTMLDHQVPTMLSESSAMAQNLTKWATPGSPLAIARTQFLAASNTVATLSAADQTPQGKMIQVTALQKAQDQMVKAVDIEASKRAGGDQKLSAIYRSQMLGLPVNPTEIEDFMRSNYVDGKGWGDVLPQEDTIRLRKSADAMLAAKRQLANSPMNLDGSKRSDKELKEEAINEALQKERDNQGTVGINVIQRSIGQRKDNPAIMAGLAPGQVEEIQIRAHNNAMKDLQNQSGITDEQAAAIMNGTGASSGLDPQKATALAQQLNVMSTQYEYDMLEQQKAGLGYEMQQWYMKNLPVLAEQYTRNLDPLKATMVGDSVKEAASRLGQMYTMADESATQRGKQAVTENVMKLKSPGTMWPTLLQQSSRMSDSQRASVYFDVISPTIKAGVARKDSPDTINAAVVQALNDYQSNDATMQSAIKTLLRDLPDSTDTYNNMYKTILGTAGMAPSNSNRGFFSPIDTDKAMSDMYPWMRQGAQAGKDSNAANQK